MVVVEELSCGDWEDGEEEEEEEEEVVSVVWKVVWW